MAKTPLIKTCSNCGEQKPLAAFLHMSGPQGTVYGSICSTCRKANRSKPKKSKEMEDSTSSSTGFKIDSKLKVQAEADKRKARQKLNELYLEIGEKETEKKLNLFQRVQTKAKDEKKHRQEFLQTKPATVDKTKQAIESGSTPEQIATREQQHNATNPLLDTNVPKEKFKWAAWNQFKDWLPNSAPIKDGAIKAARATKTPLQPTDKQGVQELVNKTLRRNPKS